LRGGFIYHDAVMDDTRLAIALLRTALRLGATAVTRLDATSFRQVPDGAIVAGCDRQSGRAIEIRTRTVVDATGPTGGFAGDGYPTGAQHDGVLLSRGIHMIIERAAIPSDMGMTLRVPGRVVFVIPWHGEWLVGTTDVPHDADAVRPQATDEEVEYLLETLRRALDVPVERNAIVTTYAGIRPLAAPRAGVSSVQASREHRIDRPSPALVRVRGGKYTTARVMATETVDAVAGKWRGKRTHEPIAGAIADDERSSFAAELALRFWLDRTLVDAIVERHGRDAENVLRLGQRMQLLRRIVPGSDVLEAEIPWAAREELAASVDDVLARRTRLALLRRDHGASAATRVAELLRPELAWSATAASSSALDYEATSAREYGLPASLAGA
jgi:glycerol-3-phosphate dehydrogenase